MSVCPDFPVSILFAVRILSGFKKKAVRRLSVRPDKDKKELSGLSLSLFVDVWSVDGQSIKVSPVSLTTDYLSHDSSTSCGMS